MWPVLLLALASTAGANAALFNVLEVEPETQERPEITDALPWLGPAWVVAVACWSVLVTIALHGNHPWRALTLTGVATVTLSAPAAVRSIVPSMRRLVRNARRNELDRTYSAVDFAAHAAQNLADPTQRLFAALKNVRDIASDQTRRVTLEDVVTSERKRRQDTAPAYYNWTDPIRLWHDASIEWLALLATLLLRAGIVAAAVSVPTSGVNPHTSVAWIALTTWSVALALAAPVAASITMNCEPKIIWTALVVEGVLLLAAEIAAPSWAVGASLAGWWNCANRLPKIGQLQEGFDWKGKVPLLGFAALGVLAVSLVVRGASPGGILADVVVALALGGLISSSYAVFFPATLYAFTRLPSRIRHARRQAAEQLGPALAEARASLEEMAADAEPVRGWIALMDAWLERGALPIKGTLGETVDALVRDRLDTLAYDGATGAAVTDEWSDDGLREAHLFGLLVAQIAAEAERHGRERLTVRIDRYNGRPFIEASNFRHGDGSPEPRTGTAALKALAAAINAQLEIRFDATTWTVRVTLPKLLVK